MSSLCYVECQGSPLRHGDCLVLLQPDHFVTGCQQVLPLSPGHYVAGFSPGGGCSLSCFALL